MKFIIIQSAFLGDVVLATPLIEAIHHQFPNAKIDFLVRKGNEGILNGHPYLSHLYIWDKSKKISSLFDILRQVRKEKYDYLINCQRFMTMGLFAALSNAQNVYGFNKNPSSLFFTQRFEHEIDGKHEIDRNLKLLSPILKKATYNPKLYPSIADYEHIKGFQQQKYVCIAPSSVWFTKQFPTHQWVKLISNLPNSLKIYLIGAPNDKSLCQDILQQCPQKNIENLAGKLSLLSSAALMEKAIMNYTNDSAPMHLASAMNAPLVAVYCSTVPQFGFGPLSDISYIVENKGLECRPCGLHGHKSCPKGHFRCSEVNFDDFPQIT